MRITVAFGLLIFSGIANGDISLRAASIAIALLLFKIADLLYEIGKRKPNIKI